MSRIFILAIFLSLGPGFLHETWAQSVGGSGGGASVFDADSFPFDQRQSELVGAVKDALSDIIDLINAIALGYALVVGLLLEMNALVGGVNNEMRIRMWVGIGIMAFATTLAQVFIRLVPGGSSVTV
jgi:hypothetical protein